MIITEFSASVMYVVRVVGGGVTSDVSKQTHLVYGARGAMP